MKKKEDPVSKKIKMLRDEGKPQDQAVAIALDMERRGKLKEIIREEVMAFLDEKKKKKSNKITMTEAEREAERKRRRAARFVQRESLGQKELSTHTLAHTLT